MATPVSIEGHPCSRLAHPSFLSGHPALSTTRPGASQARPHPIRGRTLTSRSGPAHTVRHPLTHRETFALVVIEDIEDIEVE